MIVRELVTRLGFKADDSQVRRHEAQFAQLRRAAQVTAAAAVGVGTALLGVAKSVAAAGDEIAKTAPTTGLAAREFQGYRFAADRAGIGATQFATGLMFLRRNLGDAAEGTGEAKDVFDRLGIATRDANGEVRQVKDVLRETIDAFEAMTSSAERGAAAQRLFGRSGARMGEFLRTGNAEIDALIQEFEALGGVLGDDTLKQSEEFEDRLTDLKVVMTGLRNAIGIELIPVLARLLQSLKDWAIANNAIIRQRIGAVVRGIADATGTAWRMADGAAKAFGGWANSAELLAIAIGGSALLRVLRVVLPLISALSVASLIAAGAWVVWAAGILLALLAIQDFFSFIRGEDSVFGRFVDLIERGARAMQKFADARGLLGSLPAILANPLFGAFQAAATAGGPSSNLAPEAVAALGGSSSSQVNVRNDIKLEVPAGTPEQQRTAIEQTGERVFRELSDRLGRSILNEASETD